MFTSPFQKKKKNFILIFIPQFLKVDYPLGPLETFMRSLKQCTMLRAIWDLIEFLEKGFLEPLKTSSNYWKNPGVSNDDNSDFLITCKIREALPLPSEEEKKLFIFL